MGLKCFSQMVLYILLFSLYIAEVIMILKENSVYIIKAYRAIMIIDYVGLLILKHI